ncbi:cysteine--1-D-myo-inosityl 2-amino-2-deoxy-alpha-D-glucopyranoside ligase [Nakamurella silvestris]|nr:cysteine--1-D-myo-inosityl 2-amino-2-deoxy-alpha-D-glucopyranoside ligase [Nakamurella silvestris]
MQSWPTPPVPTVPGSPIALSLYNSATREVQPTTPGPVATMYVCGITPYDATHLGHAATYLAFDLVNRIWRDNGSQVHYVQNATDIDDPLLERAERDDVDWRDLAAEQIQLFREDMTALRILPPRDYIGAVEAMDEVSAAVSALLDSGAAYRLDDPEYPDIYFDITATGRFGYESGYDEATMLAFSAERGGDPGRPGKRQALDPLLWRVERVGEPAWESPIGRGRPGWHIECAAIAGNRLGFHIDLQGGGSDLIFPHHECSAAHAEALAALTGVPSGHFAKHYTHAGMIGLDGEKMSKSRGNLVFASKLRYAGVDPMVIRLALLSGHYRSDRFWTDDLLTAAAARLATWRAAFARTGADGSGVVQTVRLALASDLDTVAAIDAIDVWAADQTLGGAEVARAVDALLGIV